MIIVVEEVNLNNLSDYFDKLSNVDKISHSFLIGNVSFDEIKDQLFEVINKYIFKSNINPENNPDLDMMAKCAVQYYHDFVKPNKHYRLPTDEEKNVLQDLSDGLTQFIGKTGIEKELETYCYDIGKKYYGTEKLRDFFAMFYNVLLGQETGPRLPNFIMIYGIGKTQEMISKVLHR